MEIERLSSCCLQDSGEVWESGRVSRAHSDASEEEREDQETESQRADGKGAEPEAQALPGDGAGTRAASSRAWGPPGCGDGTRDVASSHREHVGRARGSVLSSAAGAELGGLRDDR